MRTVIYQNQGTTLYFAAENKNVGCILDKEEEEANECLEHVLVLLLALTFRQNKQPINLVKLNMSFWLCVHMHNDPANATEITNDIGLL